jgi:beta-D-galactosyl-(1->4)-L-rhamnose phosphorylase
MVDCAYFPEAKTLVLVNGGGERQGVGVHTEKGLISAELEGFATTLISYE